MYMNWNDCCGSNSVSCTVGHCIDAGGLAGDSNTIEGGAGNDKFILDGYNHIVHASAGVRGSSSWATRGDNLGTHLPFRRAQGGDGDDTFLLKYTASFNELYARTSVPRMR